MNLKNKARHRVLLSKIKLIFVGMIFCSCCVYFLMGILMSKLSFFRKKHAKHKLNYIKLYLNTWNPAFDSRLFVKLINCKRKYQQPEKVSESYAWYRNKPPIWDSVPYLAYNNIIKHPISGLYMMYYRADDSTKKDLETYPRLDFLLNHVTALLISKDGKKFYKPSELYGSNALSVVLGLSSNVVYYGKQQSHNMFVMYDTNVEPECNENMTFYDEVLDAIDKEDYEIAKSKPIKPRKRYYVNETSFGNFAPQMDRVGRFKAIGGTDHFASRAVMPLVSSDGLKWYEPDYGRRKIIEVKQSAPAGFNGVWFDSFNQVLYDSIFKKYRIFTRHNPMTGKRSIQMFESKEMCSWKKYNNGISISFNGAGMIDNRLGFYTPNAFIAHSSPQYVLFMPMAMIEKTTKSCFMTFLYSVDGGKTAYSEVVDFLRPSFLPNTPEYKKEVVNLLNTVSYSNMYINPGIIPVVGMPPSNDCKLRYFYLLKGYCKVGGSRICNGDVESFGEAGERIVMNSYSIRYGGWASIQSNDWDLDYDSANNKTMLAIAISEKILIPKMNGKGLKILLNFETQSQGYISVGVSSSSSKKTSLKINPNRRLKMEKLSNHFGLPHACKLSGNHFAKVACWKNIEGNNMVIKEISSSYFEEGMFIQLHFEMHKAKLYSFSISTSEDDYRETLQRHGEDKSCLHKWV